MQRGPHATAFVPITARRLVAVRDDAGIDLDALEHDAATTMAGAGDNDGGGGGGGGGTTIKYVAELVNSPSELKEIKNTTDLEVAHSAFLRACESRNDQLELKVVFCRDRYVLVISGFSEPIDLDYLKHIESLNAVHPYDRYSPIEKITVDLDAGVINVNVRKIECSNQIVLQQMLLVDRDVDAGRGGGGGGGGSVQSRSRRPAAADGDDDDYAERGYAARRATAGRGRSRSRSPPRNVFVRAFASLIGAAD